MNIPLWKPFKPEFDRLSQGEATKLFEEKMAAFLNVKYAVAVSSGTFAIYLALKAYGIGVGQEVLIPDLTAIGTANAVSMTGARVRLADVDNYGVFNLERTPIDVDAIIPVHLNGRAVTGNWVRYQNGNIPVIADACQALGSRMGSKYLGTISDCGCFSFSPTKTIFTGQGGMIVTNHYWLYDRIKMLRDQGRKCKGENYLEASGNFKFTDLQAKIAIEQYEQLPSILERKRHVYEMYYEQLEQLMYCTSKETVIWLPDIYHPKRNQLHKHLKEKGITTRKFYPPIHTQQPYLTHKDFPNSERLSQTGLWLPSNVTDEEISYICKTIKDYLHM